MLGKTIDIKGKRLMTQVATFEKVSKEQFYCDVIEEFGSQFSKEEINQIYDDIKLPKRSTSKSAGYDFYSPFDFTLSPTEVIKIPSGIRVKIDSGWFLCCVPRSGLGFKYFETLANTMGVIDGDFYDSDNEGHIMIKLVNRFPTERTEFYPLSPEVLKKRTMEIKRGKAIVQGIFIPFGITYNDVADGVRNGGLGSTDRIGG